MLVLKHMYKDDAPILSITDAQALATFAHKYNVRRLHKRSEAYLAEHIQLTTAVVFDWAQLAERIELGLLLAHCEQYIILHFHGMSALQKKVSSISQSSLLRIMDGLAGRDMEEFVLFRKSGAAVNLCLRNNCNTLYARKSCPQPTCIFNCSHHSFQGREGRSCIAPQGVARVHASAARRLLEATVPSVECLLQWQKTGSS